MGLFSGLKSIFGLDEGEEEAKGRARKGEKKADAARLSAREKGRNAKADALAQLDARTSAAAKAERARVLADEKSRFVRLREAAQEGGFNPLTVLQSGFLGSSVPLGFLSEGSSAANFFNSRAIGMDVWNAELAGHDTVNNVRMQGDANVLQGMANDNSFIIAAAQTAIQGGSAWSAHSQGQKNIDLRGQELELSRSVASTGIGTPGWGDSRLSRRSGPSLSDRLPENSVPRNPDGSIKDRDLARGEDLPSWKVDETWSPAQYWEDEYGEVATEVVGGIKFGRDVWSNSQVIRPQFEPGSPAREAWRVLDTWVDDRIADAWGGMREGVKSHPLVPGGNTAFKVTVPGS